MTVLQERIDANKFNTMQLRARGLSTERTSQLHNEISLLRELVVGRDKIIATKEIELQNVVAQRDDYACRCFGDYSKTLIPGT